MNADHLIELANGRDPRAVSPAEVEKSISSDRTTDVDLTELDQVSHALLQLSDDVAGRLRTRSMVARTIGIKIRFADFRTITRVRTLPDWVDSGDVLHATALELYRQLDLGRPRIRLVGVKAEGLRPTGSAPQQLSFDDVLSAAGPDPRPEPTRLDRVADDVRQRFGAQAIGRATTLPATTARPITGRDTPRSPTSRPAALRPVAGRVTLERAPTVNAGDG